MRRRALRDCRLGAILLFLVSAGCDRGAGPNLLGPYHVSRPAHPAMTAAAAGGETGSAHVHDPTDPHAGVPGAPPLGRNDAARGAASAPAPDMAPRSEDKGALNARLAELGLTLKVPDGWSEEGGSGIRLGTIRLPRVEGDDADGEMSITVLGGSLDANLERWRGQFAERPAPVRKDWTTAGGVAVTTVFLEGTFSAGMGPGGGGPTPDTVLLGAIAALPEGDRSLFFKSWGPRATMERWRESFDAFVESLALR